MFRILGIIALFVCVAVPLGLAWRHARSVTPLDNSPVAAANADSYKPLKSGDIAPDFRLRTMQGEETVELRQFRGHKPVALIFGSCT